MEIEMEPGMMLQMTISDLKEKFGRPIPASELAAFFGVDLRTLKKYAHLWGGIEVAPGRLQFFEKLVEDRINAQLYQKTREASGEGSCHGSGKIEREAFSGRQQKKLQECGNLGRETERKNNGGDKKRKKEDPYGLLSDTS